MLIPFQQSDIISQNNLTLCQADFFITCWCPFNSTTPVICPYLLRHLPSMSNGSLYCFYHIIRRSIDCINTTSVFSSETGTPSAYIVVTIILFIIGLIGNGLSMFIAYSTNLCRSNIYRNLVILCLFNIIYLLLILIRYTNIYGKDIRDISPSLSRIHIFLVAFFGHLCSWQLVSTSIQRVYALLTLKGQSTTPWRNTWLTLITTTCLPLLILDGQLLMKNGYFAQIYYCNRMNSTLTEQFRRALNFPISRSQLPKNISVRQSHRFTSFPNPTKNTACIIWNMLDTFIYALVPFAIILICNLIIIIQVIRTRRLAASFGGITRRNQNHLSQLVIFINILFIIMTAPYNASLLIQAISRKQDLRYWNIYLSSLQNAYHAFAFLLYFVMGRKFRHATRICFRRIFLRHRFNDSNQIHQQHSIHLMTLAPMIDGILRVVETWV